MNINSLKSFLFSIQHNGVGFVRTLLLFCLVFSGFVSFGFSETDGGQEELSISLNVKGIGSAEIPALYRDQEIFLSVTDVFNFLKIKNSFSEAMDSVSGFLIDENATFIIDKNNNVITYQQKKFELSSGELIRSDGKLYLRGYYFGAIFGLECSFNFRNLAVNLNTDLELPVIREMRQELMRANVNRLNGEEKADSTIGRKYPGARIGMADWSLINTHNTDRYSNVRFSMGLGTVLAGGETNLVFNYDSKIALSPKQQYYLWRYVNNEQKALRQLLIGKVQPQFTSSVYSPSVGFQITNEATTFKRSFGTYTLSNTTQPGWIVELYVNNVLVSYVKADASGFYTFQVPLVYGNSTVKLRFYGPYGEERSLEEYVNIPFNFLPKNQFEYNVSVGFVEDGFHSYTSSFSLGDSVINTQIRGKENSRFTRAKFNYGLNRFITMGGGVEYLSSVTSGSTMPFVNTSIRIAPMLLLTAEYTDKVVAKGMLSYRLPSNVQFEMGYAKFDKDQTAIHHSYRDQLKAIVSFPFHGKNFSAYSRMSADHIVLESTHYTNLEWMLSGTVSGVSANLSSYAVLMNQEDPLVYSNLSLGFRLPFQFVITPQVQYEYTRSELISGKLSIEKRVNGFGLLNAFYEENVRSHIHFFGFGFRLDLSFAQAGFMAVKNNYNTTFTEMANGSFIYNQSENHIHTNNRSSIGKGGIVISPFLDLNSNGKRETGEPRAEGLKVIINGGRLENNIADTVTQIFDLEPFTNYFIKIQPQSFDNINWSVRNKTIKVVTDPNYMKLVEIPVTVSAEVSGMVYLESAVETKGLGKIVVLIFNSDSNLVARTMTESDGYFSLMTLRPGNYTARIDAAQLTKLNFTALPDNRQFSIQRSIEGDVINGLNFTIRTNTKDSQQENEK